jgi:hypothetical protein
MRQRQLRALVTPKSAPTGDASQQVELLAAFASDQGFEVRRRALLFEESVRIFFHFEFRILGDACSCSGAAIWTHDFKQGSITRHGCEISANAWLDQAAIAFSFLESM